MAIAEAQTAAPIEGADLAPAAVIAGMFRDAFEIDNVGLDDNFFRLGGDSLIGETLIMEIERVFGIDLSISALIDAATPRALAALIEQAGTTREPSLMIRPRASGSGMKLICVHGFDGESMFPERLANALPGDNPIVGFRAMGLEPGEQPLARVEQFADQYLALLKEKIQPTGPYLLLGHCGGSSIAWDMAQKLTAAGETVVGLIIIDPAINRGAPFLYRNALLWHAIEHLRFRRKRRALDRLIASTPSPDLKARKHAVSRALSIAVAYYKPKPLACPTLFIHTKVRREHLLNPRRGYQTLLRKAEYAEVDVEHLELFTDGLPDLVRLIRGFLDRVATPHRQAQTA